MPHCVIQHYLALGDTSAVKNYMNKKRCCVLHYHNLKANDSTDQSCYNDIILHSLITGLHPLVPLASST